MIEFIGIFWIVFGILVLLLPVFVLVIMLRLCDIKDILEDINKRIYTTKSKSGKQIEETK